MDQIERERHMRGEMVADFFCNPNSIEALKGKSIQDCFEDEENMRATIEEMTQEEFEQFVCGVNGTLVGKNRDSWKIEDEREVELSSPIAGRVFTPRPEDKRELLNQTFHAAQEMNREGRGAKDIALLIATSVNAVHPWEDGNGRTSRVLYSLLASGEILKDKSHLLKLVSEDGRGELPLSPQTVSVDLDQIMLNEADANLYNLFADGPTRNFSFQEGVTEDQKKDLLEKYRFDEKHFAIAVSKVFSGQANINEYLREFPNERVVIMFDKLVSDLSPEEIELLLKEYGGVKKKKVELLIDCIQNPDKEKYKVGQEEKTARLLDKLRNSLDI